MSGLIWIQTVLHSLSRSIPERIFARCRFDPRRAGNILSQRFDHEIFSPVIISLLLIQEGQISVSGEIMCTILVNRLED